MKKDEIKVSPVENLKIILEKSGTGYSAFAPGHAAIYTAADTYEEVIENIEEVIAHQVEYLEESGDQNGAETLRTAKVEYYLDVKQFFAQYPMLNKSEFAHFIGMNPSMMRKIGSGIVALSDTKAKQIQEGLHRLANSLSQIHFV